MRDPPRWLLRWLLRLLLPGPGLGDPVDALVAVGWRGFHDAKYGFAASADV